jgi:hypothetical protein
MKKIAIIVIIFLIGCASPGIVQLSPDTYMLTKEDHGGIFAFNRGNLKTDSIREANAFAESQGKVAIPVSAHEHPVGILGDWASFEYQFRVVDKNDSEARRTSLTPRADFVIEKTERLSADIHTKNQSEKSKDVYAELIKLDDLREKGIISDAEFESQKKKLLAGN